MGFDKVLTLCSDCKKEITVNAKYEDRNKQFKCEICKGKQFKVKTSAHGFEGGKVVIETDTHTIVLCSEWFDDAHYVADAIDDCTFSVDVISKTE